MVTFGYVPHILSIWRLLPHMKILPKSDLAPLVQAYEDLSVKHEPLKLITPQFETPLPPLQAAVFPPSFR